ncbi:heme exporter protein CcmD [Marinicauda salina]|uniref:Heme exporter protein D n=1 Tax=Marinicauda salina TaxID=2135793 RepID=A0A2U2BW62_9PROT|nr:heme exporter protein CcmD [Marinicauda salina]PWE18261.1 heme exporter protein CcmD [Marinicauda salina]
MSEYFAMGGYAGYVWASYALAAAGVGALVAAVLVERAKARARLDRIRALEAEDSVADAGGES